MPTVHKGGTQAFLKATDIKNGEKVTIKNEGEYVDKFDRTLFQIGVALSDGTEKTYTMNQTTLNDLIDAWGEETEKWVGKKLSLSIVKQNVRGDMRDVIYGSPAK